MKIGTLLFSVQRPGLPGGGILYTTQGQKTAAIEEERNRARTYPTLH